MNADKRGVWSSLCVWPRASAVRTLATASHVLSQAKEQALAGNKKDERLSRSQRCPVQFVTGCGEHHVVPAPRVFSCGGTFVLQVHDTTSCGVCQEGVHELSAGAREPEQEPEGRRVAWLGTLGGLEVDVDR